MYIIEAMTWVFVEERVDEELKGSAHKVAIEYLNVVLKSRQGPFNGRHDLKAM